ncbi:MAG: aldo/keto reductase [Saprospiraceae bacterium]|nr:aldo/keto reductase [Saprospiraceae bacterium]
MKYKAIGRSGLISSNLSLGTMIFGEDSDRSTPEADAIKMIDQYLAQGGNHIDTADGYAKGRSEEIVGKAVKGKRENLIIATKVRFPTSDDVNDVGLSRYHIIQGVEQSLNRLNTDRIDLLYVHCWDPITPLDETVRALDDLVRSGKVRYLGLSNFKAWQSMKAQALCDQLGAGRFIAGQYQYSLVKRDIEHEFFDLFESEGLGLMPWGPLGGGFLTGKYERSGPTSGRIATTHEGTEESWARRNTEKNWKILDAVKEVAAKHNASPVQIALAWVLSKQVVSSLVIGARTMTQLEDNLKANEVTLDKVDLATLNELSTSDELYPYRFISSYGKRKF